MRANLGPDIDEHVYFTIWALLIMNVQKTTRLFDDRLRSLLKTSAGIFARKGYEGTSIREIARQAGLGLSNIYYYVTCKEELLYLIQRDTFDSLLREASKEIAGVDDPEERLRIIVHNHISHFAENMAELNVCARELGTLTGEYYEDVRKIRRDYFDLVLGTVRELTDRHGSTLDPWLTTANLFGMMNWFYQWYGMKAGKIRPEELADQQVDLILGGIWGREGAGEMRQEGGECRLEKR